MTLKLPRLREVLSAISKVELGVNTIFLVVNEEEWEIVSDSNKGISGYVSHSYDMEPYDGDSGYYRDIAESMLRDVKDDYINKH